MATVLRVHIDAALRLGLTRVPSFILQPLLENAIKHGVANGRGRGCIAVLVGSHGGRLILDVVDDWPGVAGECADDPATVHTVRKLLPDLMFLDIQMPGLDGFGVIHEIDPGIMSAVVFVTAYDEHAVEAFRVNALDYLLKPLDPALVRTAVDRHLARAATAAGARAAAPQLRDGAAHAYVDRCMVRVKGRMFLVKTADIDWFESADNYLGIHTAGSCHLIPERIGSIAERLDPRHFLRIHRTTIVNLDSVRELQPWSSGEMIVIMNDGATLKLSRGYRKTACSAASEGVRATANRYAPRVLHCSGETFGFCASSKSSGNATSRPYTLPLWYAPDGNTLAAARAYCRMRRRMSPSRWPVLNSQNARSARRPSWTSRTAG